MNVPAPVVKAATVGLVLLTLGYEMIARLLGRDDVRTGSVATGDADADTIQSFDAAAEDTHGWRPTRKTLADAAAEASEYNVYTERRVEIDPDRIGEWVDANYDDKTRVKITTKYGTDVYTRGEPVPTECPVCGEEPTLLKGFGDNRVWIHVGEDRRCSVEVSGE